MVPYLLGRVDGIDHPGHPHQPPLRRKPGVEPQNGRALLPHRRRAGTRATRSLRCAPCSQPQGGLDLNSRSPPRDCQSKALRSRSIISPRPWKFDRRGRQHATWRPQRAASPLPLVGARHLRPLPGALRRMLPHQGQEAQGRERRSHVLLRMRELHQEGTSSLSVRSRGARGWSNWSSRPF